MRIFFILSFLLLCTRIFTQESPSKPDFSNQKTLYVVATAHFNPWSWTIKSTINEHLPNIVQSNIGLFEKYPFYKFNFDGAFKYMLLKEYYPSEYEKVKNYIKTGQWNICGSSLSHFDVNIPSPYALSRSILLGQEFFRKEFSTISRDIFLPNGYGFSYALPTVAAFCGLKAFSTQKLSWGAAFGIPFDIGTWQGVDGSKIFAAFNAGNYTSGIKTDLSNDEFIIKKLNQSAKENGGLQIGYQYFRIDNKVGAPKDSSLYWLDKSLHATGPVKIVNAPADDLGKTLSSEDLKKFQVYNGELLMSTHGTGCYTSQAAIKLWNRKNEVLAEASEKAATIANYFGNPYPREKLNNAWTRFLWHQSYNDITGTSIPEALPYTWNDQLLSLNQFTQVLENSAAGIFNAMNTKTKHVSLVVFNPLSIAREDVVEVEIVFPKTVEGVRVNNKEGKEIVCQLLEAKGNKAKILFLANVPSLGFEFYEVQQTGKQAGYQHELKASAQSIENSNYVLFFDQKTGDIKRILEKSKMRDLLSKPLRLAFFNDTSEAWPAWEILYKTIASTPKGYLDKVKSIEAIENGPIRATIKLTREREGSVITQYIRLYSGKPGERIEFYTEVDWKTQATLLKADFSLALATSKATYDLGMGTIQRGNNSEKLYEVPAQNWVDVTLPDGSFGISLFSDSKYGWDKPNNNTIRLSLLHTPKTGKDFSFQATNDIGRHEFSYALYAHLNDWKKAKTQWIAAAFNQPLLAFQTSSHDGPLGKSFSFASLNSPDVMIKTLKKAENSDEIVVHFQELIGARAGNVKLSLPAAVITAREINGAEEYIGDGRIENSQLVFNINPHQPKAFALKLAAPQYKPAQTESFPLTLDYNLDGVSNEGKYTDGNIDLKSTTIPAEQFPEEIIDDCIKFKLGPSADVNSNLLVCNGQQISLPQGIFNKVYILAFALKDSKAEFKTDAKADTFEIPYFSGFIGQWDGYNRTEKNFTGDLAKAYLKKAPVVWNSTHLHTREGNKAYEFAYLFKFAIDITKDTKTLTLPNNPDIIVAAITLANDVNTSTKAAQSMIDNIFKK